MGFGFADVFEICLVFGFAFVFFTDEHVDVFNCFLLEDIPVVDLGVFFDIRSYTYYAWKN